MSAKQVRSRPQRADGRDARVARTIRRVALYAVLVFWACVSLYPFYFALVSSFKINAEIFREPFAPPLHVTIENYIRAWNIANMGVYFRNSIALATMTVVLLLITGSMASFVLSRLRFRLNGVIFIFMIMGMMIPIHSTIVPLAFMIGRLHLRDNYIVLSLLYTAFQLPMTVFVLTGFMKSIPSDLEEAAVMDGCRHWQVYRVVIIPLSTSALATVSVFNSLYAWNDLLFPLLFVSKRNLRTISLGLISFFGERNSDYGGVMAAIVLAFIPPLIAYALFQRRVEAGLTAGAVKG
jgi:raffinose/stachyose/melibiose transport system permease protein